jgi:MFS family permease
VTTEAGHNRPPEQITRNLNELLQELRVMQTGVQILTGFLLTVPFSERFTDLADYQRRTYLGILVAAVLTTLVIVAPVCYHRLLFRQGRREWLVAAAHLCLIAGMCGLGLVSGAVVFLVFDIVAGMVPAVVAAAAVALAFIGLWAVVPFSERGRQR